MVILWHLSKGFKYHLPFPDTHGCTDYIDVFWQLSLHITLFTLSVCILIRDCIHLYCLHGGIPSWTSAIWFCIGNPNCDVFFLHFLISEIIWFSYACLIWWLLEKQTGLSEMKQHIWSWLQMASLTDNTAILFK